MNDRSNEQRNGSSENRSQPLYVTLIIDETGSMQECKGAAIAGFNQYVATLRQEPAETRVTLTLFNSRKTEVRYQATPVARVHDLDVETYRPRDTTPLYDAIGRTLVSARLQVPAGSRKLCVILTDGEENASKEYSRSQIFDMIKAYENEGWTFLYLGADHDVWAAGDIARYPEQRLGTKVRIEHWAAAERQGQRAAADMLGMGAPFNDVPFFWSAHYDVQLSYVGHAAGDADIEVLGNLEKRDATVVYRTAGKVAAVLTVGRDRQSLEIEAALECKDWGAVDALLQEFAT
jgi:hypothetical protein